MDSDPKSALKSTVLASLPILREQAGRFSEPHLVWRKVSKGQWSGTYEDRPNL
jgi:hypothetical protein